MAREAISPVFQSERNREMTTKNVLGGHVPHGGRHDLGPSMLMQLPHDGASKLSGGLVQRN